MSIIRMTVRASAHCLLLVLLVSLGVLSFAMPVVAAQAPASDVEQRMAKLDRALERSVMEGCWERLRVIVRLTSGSRSALDAFLAATGGRVVAELPLVHAVTVEVDSADLLDLASLDGVERLSSDGRVVSLGAGSQKAKNSKTTKTTKTAKTATSSPADTATTTAVTSGDDLASAPGAPTTTEAAEATVGAGLSWGLSGLSSYIAGRSQLLTTLGVNDLSTTGLGVGVAVIDSGIEENLDIGLLAGWYDFTAAGSAEPYDDFGHGTHVAGLIAGSGTLSGGQYTGVARSARLIGLKVLDAGGTGYTSDVIRALDYAVTNRQALGIHIINLSLGHPIYEPAATDPLVQAVERAVAAGIVVVASAGNHGLTADGSDRIGYAGITSPGNAPSAITVGALDDNGTATRTDDSVARFSSRGPTWYDGSAKPDIVAPGRRIVAAVSSTSALYQAQSARLVCGFGCVLGFKPQYLSLSGTSMASAVAAGAAALVLDANPALTPYMVKALLSYTATNVPGEDSLAQGAGSLNVGGAIALARVVDPTAPLNTPWLTSGIDQASTIGGETISWAQRIVWGDRVVWGDWLILHNDAAWSQRVLWGDHVLWGDGILWGDGVLWGDSVLWGDRVLWGDSVLEQHVLWGDRVVWGDGLADCAGANGVLWGDVARALGLASTAQSWVSFFVE
ncbi:MAG: S8 family serine peptidase [Acidobacteria bacterium]|nr:S8 family serine peptidase [Acidobacteriota bacterium]